MPNVLTVSSNNNWRVLNKNVYSCSGLSANNGTTTTALFNIWANGISAVDGIMQPYRVTGNVTAVVKDFSGNPYTAISAEKRINILSYNDRHCVLSTPARPLPPVELPAYTFRFQFSNTAYNPVNVGGWKSGSTWTKVTSGAGLTNNQWDYTHTTANWDDEFNGKFTAASNVVDILYAGDFSNVTSMANKAYVNSKVAGGTFGAGTSDKTSYIKSICSFDTSNVKNMDGIFFHCGLLTTLPSLNTSACSSFWSSFDTCGSLKWVNGLSFKNTKILRSVFANCNLRILPDISDIIATNLISADYAFLNNTMCGEYGSPGILAAYSYLSATRGTHRSTFASCGTRTPAGSAELAQIPDNWKK